MAAVETSELTEFCDFVLSLRDQGLQKVTPEDCVEIFRFHQRRRREFHEMNRISEEQARRGEAKPLDLDAVMSRVRERLAERGIVD